MLQFIMDRNLLLYVLAAACVVGAASQMILRQVYQRMIKDVQNTGAPEGRFLQQLRQRFQYCSHLNEKVSNVQAFVQKGLIEYRFWGMSLHRWKRIGLDCLAVSILCAFAGSAVIVRDGGTVIMGNTYFWLGVLSAALTAAAYGISDTGYERESLEIRLTDYLENSGAMNSFGEEENEFEQDRVTSMPAMESGRKARKRARAELAAAQTRAQKEKRDLKENIARLKTGMQESAADRERNLDLLRQMDTREQERILKEVLKEVLS